MLLATTGKDEQARADFRKVLELSPQTPDVHYNIGFSLARMGRLDDAIVEHSRALAANPEDSHTRNNLGLARRSTPRRHAHADSRAGGGQKWGNAPSASLGAGSLY
jgi:Flp pilus assembly protein TadD